MTGADPDWAVVHTYAWAHDRVLERLQRFVPKSDLRVLQREGEVLRGFIVWRWDPQRWPEVRKAGVLDFAREGGSGEHPLLSHLSEITDPGLHLVQPS